MRYNSSSAADTTIGIAASYLRTGIDPRGGEWRTTLGLGNEPGFATGVYEPLGPKALFFVEPRAEWRSTLYNVFDGDRVASAIDIRESVLEASGGRELRGATEIRAGVRGGGGVYRVHAGDPAFAPADSFRRGEAFVRLSVDTLDGVAFPRAGAATSVEWRRSSPTALGADEPFTQLLARASVAKSWRRHTVLGALRYDATTSGTAPLYARFRMGGFRDLSGLDRGQLTGQQAARAGVSYYRAFGDSMLFPAFAGITVERGNVWEKRSDVSFGAAIAGVSVWAGIGTPVGPVYLGTGRTDDGRSAVYLALGGAF
jgi:NTE family protein